MLIKCLGYQLLDANQVADVNKLVECNANDNIHSDLTCHWLCVAEMSDYMDKVDRLKCLVLNMPPPNHDTLLFMCRHLKR